METNERPAPWAQWQAQQDATRAAEAAEAAEADRVAKLRDDPRAPWSRTPAPLIE